MDLIRNAEERKKTEDFDNYLYQQIDAIRGLVAHHLGLSSSEHCIVSPRNQWIHGRFNACIPVNIQSLSKTVLFRCPMAHMLAESIYPGTVDEKISCEVATYAWIQEHCSEISVPHLIGFGFMDGRHVS